MTRYLTDSDIPVLSDLTKTGIANRGAAFYVWRNAPEAQADGTITHTSGWGASSETRIVSGASAPEIYKQKLDGAYGERFALSMIAAIAAIRGGAKVALLQIVKEEGTPFDASGWLVMSVNGHPLFHISPDDLSVTDVEAAGLVTMVTEGSHEANVHGWKGTDKVEEFSMLLDIMSW